MDVALKRTDDAARDDRDSPLDKSRLLPTSQTRHHSGCDGRVLGVDSRGPMGVYRVCEKCGVWQNGGNRLTRRGSRSAR